MQVQLFVFNAFQENTYVLYDETNECVIIDPGCFEDGEKEELTDFIESRDLQVKMLLNTHCHIDHVLGNAFVKEKFKTQLYIHKIEEPYLRAVKTYASNYGYFTYQESEPDAFLNEGDEISFGNTHMKIFFTPGHSPGHVVFYNKQAKCLIGGDVLFYNSIGRADLPGGNFETLIRSIHQKLFTLPDETIVYPGHGPETTTGFEKKTNPFCALAP